MKKNYLFIILYTIIYSFSVCNAITVSNKLNQALTYQLNNGRFGDHLISLIKCLRFGWDYDMPVLYKSFKYSSGFEVINLMPKYEKYKGNFKQNIHFKEKRTLDNNLKQPSTLFTSSFYSLPAGDSMVSSELYLALTDPAFKKFISPLFQPSKHFNTVPLPSNRITVAVHVRKGDYEGHLASKTFLDKVWPLKFPPDSFYINSIKYISELYNDAPLYVFIFTDSSRPQALIEYYSRKINKPNILFECRHNSIGKDKLVLEDFFSILNFDCFIHSMSSYSQCATVLGDFEIRIYPHKYHWQDGHTLIIDESVMIKNNQAFAIQ